MTAYTLERVTPAGDTRTQGPFSTRRKAAQAMFFVLLDNSATRNRHEAADPCAELQTAPVGTVVQAYGYTFRLVVSA